MVVRICAETHKREDLNLRFCSIHLAREGGLLLGVGVDKDLKGATIIIWIELIILWIP